MQVVYNLNLGYIIVISDKVIDWLIRDKYLIIFVHISHWILKFNCPSLLKTLYEINILYCPQVIASNQYKWSQIYL